MSSALWRTEEFSTSGGNQASTLLREATLENRLNALREIALNLLNEVETLKGASLTARDGQLNLHDEVARFEIDLICSALQRTNGSQTRACKLLGVKQSTLNAKVKRYKIPFTGRNREADKVQTHDIAA